MSTALLKKLGIYKCLILGGFGHFCFVFAQIFPAIKYDHRDNGNTTFFTSDGFITVFLIICATINGVGAALIWVSNGSYISACATPKTKGFFYGFFWIVYMMSQVVGSLIGAAILHSGKKETFFYCSLGVLAAFASLSFWFIRKPLILEVEVEEVKIFQENKLSNVKEYMSNADETFY